MEQDHVASQYAFVDGQLPKVKHKKHINLP